MSKIKSISAREILSSGSMPTIEVTAVLGSGAAGIASVPFGASFGSHEAALLLDKDQKRYNGKGMLKAVENVNKLALKLKGKNPFDQKAVDHLMIKMDGTSNKSKLGANSILSVSLAVAKAAANENGIPFYQHIRQAFDLPIKRYALPNPMMVVIEGGKHADRTTDIQEYLISPIGAKSAKENVRYGIETYAALRNVLKSKGFSTNVGNEGAFAPSGIRSNEDPLKFIEEAIHKAGFLPMKDIGLSMDAAASEFHKDKEYIFKTENRRFTSLQMIDYLEKLVEKYPIMTLEDPLHEDDWGFWPVITKRVGSRVPIIGDDLITTNIIRLERAVKLGAINSVLIKLNQIGTLTETVDCCMMARKNRLMTVVSHRGGGETNDTSMVDLAVAVNSGFIKVGPSRGERVCKYNRLMEIEDELGAKAKPAGKNFREVV